MLTNLIIFYPELAITLAVTGLVLLGLVALNPRRRRIAVAALILAPFAPLLLLRFVLVALTDLIDDITAVPVWKRPVRWAAETFFNEAT